MTDDEYTVYEDAKGNRRAILRGGQVLCDFCLAPNPPWSYPAGPTRIVGHHLITDSDDPWGACDECHALIEADNIGALVERMVKWQPIHKPPTRARFYPPLPIVRRNMRANLLAFRDARTGPAEHDTYPPADGELT